MAKKMLKCPYCDSDLLLKQGFSGCDWNTIAGDNSGYGWELTLNCSNDNCAIVFPLVHSKRMNDISIVKEEFRHFKNYNL